MAELIETHWLALLIVLALGLFVAWWMFARNKPERERHVAPDVLDEGAAPANRNQALIDAPPAAAAMDQLAGAGTVVSAAGGEDETEVHLAEEKGEAAAAQSKPQTPPAAPHSELETPVAADRDAADELAKIKGIGPKLRTQLAGMGVTHIAQIAAWSEEDIDRIDGQLGRFSGRIRRDNWVEQARLLLSGDRAAYEAKFGKV
jgi:predicted flap endonuclease-1-like 5' DNA nuclease